MNSNAGAKLPLPLHITQALAAAESACAEEGHEKCRASVMRLAEAIIYHLGAVAVAQYLQALYSGQIEAEHTLSRSLRSLRHILPGQWLLWAARGIDSTPMGPVIGLREWYSAAQGKEAETAYETLRRVMLEQMEYLDEHGPRENVSPRELLEMVDRYRVRRGKVPAHTLSPGTEGEVGRALLGGLGSMIANADFLRDYPLYAPQQRQLLMGSKPGTPMPPISAPGDIAAAATILLYPPGEAPDYTKRPNLQAERLPLFPLDPLLAYLRCSECDRNVVAALREIVGNEPAYTGLDPRCGHNVVLRNEK